MQTENNFSDYKLDGIDRQLLKLLKRDGKLSSKELANETGLTITPVYERVKRLEKLNFIEGYVAKINKEKTGKNLRVLCNVSLKSHALEFLNKFEQEIIHLKEIPLIAQKSIWVAHFFTVVYFHEIIKYLVLRATLHTLPLLIPTML